MCVSGAHRGRSWSTSAATLPPGKRRLKSVRRVPHPPRRRTGPVEDARADQPGQLRGALADDARRVPAAVAGGGRLRGLRQTTLVGYEVMITRQLIPRIGALQLRELTPAHLNTLYLELLERGRLHTPRRALAAHRAGRPHSAAARARRRRPAGPARPQRRRPGRPALRRRREGRGAQGRQDLDARTAAPVPRPQPRTPRSTRRSCWGR